jgi:ADP-heptose:LPS heptosyltransferase
MKILQLAVPVDKPDLQLKAGVAYVMSDPIAQQLANIHRGHVQRFEIFEPYYKPYMGQDLTKKSIIIFRTGGFGDLLFITPIVEHLKRKYPTCKISVATSDRFKDVWKNNPNIERMSTSYSLPLPLSLIEKNDYVGIFEGTIENFKDKDQYCAIDSFAYSLGIFDMPLELKRPRYYLTNSEINAAKNKVRSSVGLNIQTTPYVCFQWKSSSRLRDYPYEKMITAMYKIQETTGYKIVILTHPNYRGIIEHELDMYKNFVREDKKELKYINLAGVTSFRESAAVMALSTGLVGIDSSLAHIAGALSLPSVTMYGPFKAEWRTIYNKNNISLQRQDVCINAPCAYHTPPETQDGLPFELCSDNKRLPIRMFDKFCHAMDAISPDEVHDAFIRLLKLQRDNELPIPREFKCHY